MEGQPISVEALERLVEENRPQPNPVEGAGTGPMYTYFDLERSTSKFDLRSRSRKVMK